jgi:hypothetical protein
LFTASRLPDLGGWDDSFYVAQLTSAVRDRDLLLQDDLLSFPRPLTERLRSVTTIVDSGAIQNTFSVGFAVLHGAYAWPYVIRSEERIGQGLRRLLALGSLGLLVVTVLAMVRLCEEWGFEPEAARFATAVAVVGGPLALYGTRLYLNSHLPGAFFATLVLLGLARLGSGGSRSAWAATGLAAGLLVINRWQDLVLLAVGLPLVVGWARREGGLHRPAAGELALGAAGFAGVAALQALAWRAQFSSWLLVPQGKGYVSWTVPHIAPFLLSTWNGVLPWAPGLALGLALAPFLPARFETAGVRALRAGFLLALLLTVYVSATPRDWWGGVSFGPRRLASLTPLAALGLAGLFERLRRPLRLWLAVPFLAWGVLASSAFLSHFDDLSVLFRGVPGPFNPQPPSAYEGRDWIDDWGPLHTLKPGFTFTDAPGNVDRLWGLAACAVVFGLATWAWRLVVRSSGLRLVLLAGAVAWVVVCGMWLAFAVHPNGERNAWWRAVVLDEPRPSPAPALPPGAVAAQDLVVAVHALEAGDEAAFRSAWDALRRHGAFGLDEAEVRRYARRGGPSP